MVWLGSGWLGISAFLLPSAGFSLAVGLVTLVSLVTLLFFLCIFLCERDFPFHLSFTSILGKARWSFSLVALKTWLTLFLGNVGFLHLTFQWILHVDLCTATSSQGQMGSTFPFQKTSITLALGGEFMSYLATSSFFSLYQKIEYFVFLRQVMFCSSG